MKTLTIFTPTYNRAYILPKLYESLCNQTAKDFLWLIVDDGSSDNTKELVEKWISDNIVEIRYIYQENGGKMRAHNRGVKECNTPLFLCVDSDDYLTQNSVKTIIGKYKEIKNNKKVSGLIAYRGKSEIEIIETEFPTKSKTTMQYLYDHGFSGDTSLVFKTNIIKEYLFPEIEGEKFVTENYVYHQLDKSYLMLPVPQIFIVCEYLEDGYTKNQYRMIAKNPKGYIKYYNMLIDDSNFIKKIKYSIALVDVILLGKVKNGLKQANHKFLYCLAYPFGFLVYLRRKKHA